MKSKEDEVKSKTWYALPYTIYKELKDAILNIKTILKDDKKSSDYMLKEILYSYGKEWVSESLREWVYDNYDKTLAIKDYNNLLSAAGNLPQLIKGIRNSITIEVENDLLNLNNFKTLTEHRIAIQNSIVHEFISLSELSTEEVKSLGDIYDNFI